MLKGLAVNALTAVASATLAAGAGVVGFVKDSVSAAGTFEAGMNLFAAAAGNMGQEELGQFKQLFLDLGKELPVSTQEVQDAATTLVRGGLEPAVVAAGALKDSLLFAAAAGMDLAAAAELSIKQLGTFGDVNATAAEQTAFLAEAQNLLVKAAGASTLDVATLGDAMLAAGGQAAAMDIEYRDFVTTMGLISPAFGSAAEAGTSYKNFLVRLQPTTEKATEAMLELGLITEDGTNKFFDSTGAFIGNRDAAELLQQAFEGLSPQQQTFYAQTIAGNDAMGALMALVRHGGEGFDEFAAKMAGANGVMEQAAETQLGFDFQMNNLKGSIEALQITIGSALLPILTPLIGKFTEGVNQGMAFAEMFIAAATDAGIFSNEVRDVVGSVSPALADLWRAADQVGIAFQTYFPIAQAAATVAMTTVQGVITSVLAVVVPAVQAGLAMLATFWQAHGAQIMAFVQTTWATIQSIVTTALQIVWAILQPMLATWTTEVTTHGTAIQGILTNVWEIISSVITAALAIIQGVLQAALAVMQGDWQGAWEAIQAMSVTVTQALGTIIFAFLDSIALAMGNTWDTIASQVTAGWGYVVENTTRGVQLVLAAVQELVTRAGEIGSAFINGISAGITGAIGGLVSAARNAAQSAVNAARAALNIQSPSQVMADQVGLPMAQGMAQGITAGAPLVAASAAMAAGAGVAGAQSTVNRTTNNYFNQTVHSNASASTVASDFAMMRAIAGAS